MTNLDSKHLEIKFIDFINESVKSRKIVNEALKDSSNPEAVLKMLTKAVNSRNYCGIYYEGDESVQAGFRLILPFCIGKGYQYWKTHINKRGTEVTMQKVSNTDVMYLRAYVILDTSKDKVVKAQFKSKRKSASKTGKKVGWRIFKINLIKDCQNLGKVFSTYREGYNPKDTNFVEILTSLPLDKFPRGLYK